MNRLIAACLLLLSGCTTNPYANAADGALYGAAMGAGMGALMTIPCFGCGALPGAIAGAMMGSAAGLASTPPPSPLPPLSYYPGYPYP
jgi:hypothetical protein